MDLAITFVSVFIVFEYVDRVTLYLDRKYSWITRLSRRLLMQIGLAVIVPCLMAIFLTYLQDVFIYNQVLLETDYFMYEFPASVLLVVIVNLVFVVAVLLRTSNENIAISHASRDNPDTKIILGKKGNKSIPMFLEDIAYINLRNGLPFLTNYSNDVTILSENLDHYEQILPSADFFRVNRQTIINRSSCKSFKAVENGKIEVLLDPDMQDTVIVSQKRASKFRAWVKG